MTGSAAEDQRAAIRRAVAWILVGALCIAALTAIIAVLSGNFDETDLRVIGSSVGFAIYSATGASGATLRLRQSENLRMLGLATIISSASAFLLLLTALWTDDWGGDAILEWWGIATLVTFACSHAALMAGAFRDADSDAVRLLGVASIALAVLDSGIGVLAIAGAFDEIDESAAQFLAVLVILMLLTTALTPVVRRLQRSAVEGPAPRPVPAHLAAEVIAVADRLEALNADPGNRAPEIRREIRLLRELARSYLR